MNKNAFEMAMMMYMCEMPMCMFTCARSSLSHDVE